VVEAHGWLSGLPPAVSQSLLIWCRWT